LDVIIQSEYAGNRTRASVEDPEYEEMVFKFIEHFYFIASAMNRPGDEGIWDEEWFSQTCSGCLTAVVNVSKYAHCRTSACCATTSLKNGQRINNTNNGLRCERMRRMPELKTTIIRPEKVIMVLRIADAHW
jgi:hypothetical protein